MFSVSEYLTDWDKRPQVRAIGFGMGFFGMLAGIGVAIVAGVLGMTGLGFCAAGLIAVSFVLLPVTDINLPRRRNW